MINIDALKSLSNNNFVKSSKYKITFNPPAAIAYKYTREDIEAIEALTFSVTVPAANYLTYDWVSKGVPIKIPYQKSYGDLITNHHIDGKGTVRAFFQDWHNKIMNNGTNNFEYLENYIGDIIIRQYADGSHEDLDAIATWKMDRIYPIIIGGESLSYDSNDQLSTFDITWSYNILQLLRPSEGK